jgi:hypothetical protein
MRNSGPAIVYPRLLYEKRSAMDPLKEIESVRKEIRRKTSPGIKIHGG